MIQWNKHIDKETERNTHPILHLLASLSNVLPKTVRFKKRPVAIHQDMQLQQKTPNGEAPPQSSECRLALNNSTKVHCADHQAHRRTHRRPNDEQLRLL
jgi:hypothetical protein